jgi:hypothetical protein
MNDKTVLLGEVRDRLLALGYAPTSAVAPGAHGHRIIDDPAAVLCVADDDKRSVLALTITVRDKAIRAAILAVFAKHGVGKGCPVRVSSDGSETFIVRPSPYRVPGSRTSTNAPGEHLPAVALDGKERPDPMGKFPVPTFVRLSGVWRQDLLTVAHDDLPQLDSESTLFDEVEEVLRAAGPKSETQWGIPKREPKKRPEDGDPVTAEPFVYKPEGVLPNEDNRRQFHVPDPTKGRARA